MQLRRYRFNRKTGEIYYETKTNKLISVGSQLKVIILWASEPVWGKPFPHLPAQHWVQLTFLDEQGFWCYGVLNSGITNALYSWVEYRKKIESRSLELFEIITTISFDSQEAQHEWFGYSFSGVRGKPGLGERMRELIGRSQYSPIDLDLDLPV